MPCMGAELQHNHMTHSDTERDHRPWTQTDLEACSLPKSMHTVSWHKRTKTLTTALTLDVTSLQLQHSRYTCATCCTCE